MATPNKADYEEVPDAETPVIPPPETNPRELYPEADEDAARLLGDLDTVIKLPNPQVKLPRVKASSLAGAPTTWKELLEAMKTPTLTFLGIAVAAIATIVWGSPLVQKLFPYIACVIEFVATVPALIERFTKQSNVAFETLDEAQGTVDAQVDAVTFKVTFIIDSIQDLVRKVLEPARPKIKAAQKVKGLLQKHDDTIEIPDPDDIERELDGCDEKVQTTMEQVKKSIDMTKAVPICFRSPQNFSLYVVYPILVVFLALQVYGVYQSSQTVHDATDGSVQETASDVTRRFLRGSVEQDLDAIVEEVRTSTMSSQTSPSDEKVSWYPIWVALQVYLSAIAELVIGFLLSQAYMIAASLNIAVGRIENEANQAIETMGASQVFDEYLTTKMEALRANLLKLVHAMLKIDKVQKQFNDSPSATAENVVDSVKEKIEEKKKKGFQLPWSPFGKK